MFAIVSSKWVQMSWVQTKQFIDFFFCVESSCFYFFVGRIEYQFKSKNLIDKNSFYFSFFLDSLFSFRFDFCVFYIFSFLFVLWFFVFDACSHVHAHSYWNSLFWICSIFHWLHNRFSNFQKHLSKIFSLFPMIKCTKQNSILKRFDLLKEKKETKIRLRKQKFLFLLCFIRE